jgi:glycosyltransferase involved in cell wall biosynthesis
VALLAPRFWPEVGAAPERILRGLADGLAARGHRPRLITCHRGRPSRSVENGISIVRNWRPPERPLRRRCYENYLTHVPFSYLSLARGDDEIAHAMHVADGLAALRWSRSTDRPAILTYMGVPDRHELFGRRRRLEITERVARGCTVVALSEAAAAAFSRWLGVEARVIYPGVDLAAFEPAGERAEHPTIFCPAPEEAMDLLMSAFRLVRRDRQDAQLRLLPSAGPPPGPSALASEYGRAWASVLPSPDAEQSVALVESLACGTPAVVVDAAGTREVLDREAVGRLFSGDENELAAALLGALELASQPATIEACRERAADFSTERATDKYLDLYGELLGRELTAPSGERPPAPAHT